jgi:hypothetical protein
MKSHCARGEGRKSVDRASISGIVLFITLVCTAVLAPGCGESPRPQAVSQSTTQSVAVSAVTQTSDAPSSTDRVTTEQARETGAAAAHDPTTTTTAAIEPQPTTTTSTGPPVGPDTPTSAVLAGGQTPLKGVWSGTADRLASFLLGVCPSPSFTVPTSDLADYYVRYCAEAGLRADLLWAQMIHETGYGMYGGDVMPEQNNYAGIGAIGGGALGAAFPSAEAGVMAQVAHMVAYVYASSPVAWANATTDPRFDLVSPRGVASVLSDLDGRWSVPGTGYGENIEAIARAINAD